ncbi:MAG: hypothetical protein WAL46_02045 [Nitrososphaeraceae archaeon]
MSIHAALYTYCIKTSYKTGSIAKYDISQKLLILGLQVALDSAIIFSSFVEPPAAPIISSRHLTVIDSESKYIPPNREMRKYPPSSLSYSPGHRSS